MRLLVKDLVLSQIYLPGNPTSHFGKFSDPPQRVG